MADDTPVIAPPKTPWHLWTIGGLSLLWNAVGALDFTMTEARNAAYLKGLTPEQLDYVLGFPLWVVLAWGVATWGSLLGSAVLLMRRAYAVTAFAVSFVAMLGTMTHNYLLSEGRTIMGGGLGPLIFGGVIMMIGALLWIYARRMAREKVLR